MLWEADLDEDFHMDFCVPCMCLGCEACACMFNGGRSIKSVLIERNGLGHCKQMEHDEDYLYTAV